MKAVNNRRTGLLVASALASGLWGTSAAAQTSVTVYGIVDAALAHTNNVDAAGNSVTKVGSLSGSLPSRIGFRGSEDLGGGLSRCSRSRAVSIPIPGRRGRAVACSGARPGSD